MSAVYSTTICGSIISREEKQQDVTIQNMFNVTSFPNHQGFYYESHGRVKVSHLEWNLVTFIDLSTRISKYSNIMSQYNITANLCNSMLERFGSVRLSNTCAFFTQQFSHATLPYINEIEANYNNMMLAISNNVDDRVRRGIGDTIKRFGSVIHGVLSKLDTEFIFNRILALANNMEHEGNFIPERTRITQTEAEKTTKFLQYHKKMDENLEYLKSQIQKTAENLDLDEYHTKLLDQAFLFEVILNQYSFQTQNLLSIVNSALNGKIHTSLFSSKRLIKELQEIQMHLPTGSALPLEIRKENIPEIIRIAEINIFQRKTFLIFSISIPLITNAKYNVYKPISLPIPYNNDTIVLITPETDYLALRDDNDEYFILEAHQWETCSKLESYTLCKGNQPFQHRGKIELCELSQFVSQGSLANDCEVKFLTVDAPIWHRLTQANSWIFYTQPVSCTITCSEPQKSMRIEIAGVGRLTVSPSCEIHTDYSVIVSASRTERDVRLDIIPENKKTSIISLLVEKLRSLEPQKFTNVNLIKDINYLAHKALKLNLLRHKIFDQLFIFRIEFHITVLYFFIISLILAISIYIYKFTEKNVKMYKPDVADSPEDKPLDT